MSHLEKLRELEDLTMEAIVSVDPDKRSPLIAQYRAVLSEIAELEGSDGSEVVESNGLIDFQAALAERRRATT